MNESELIIAAQQGDLGSFNRLVLAYQDAIFTQAFRMLGERESAEDATQEAFISAFKHIRSFRGGSFKAWLFRIVTNACYDELRRQKRRPTIPLEAHDPHSDEEIEDSIWMRDESETPEESAQRKELTIAIQGCLNRLPAEFRSVTILVDIQGMNYLEAAEVIGKPVGTIKSRLSRARMRLQECLHAFWELLPDRFRLIYEAIP